MFNQLNANASSSAENRGDMYVSATNEVILNGQQQEQQPDLGITNNLLDGVRLDLVHENPEERTPIVLELRGLGLQHDPFAL